MKVFFIVYEEEATHRVRPLKANTITIEFPIKWLLEYRDRYNGGNVNILWWKEIEMSEEEYTELKLEI